MLHNCSFVVMNCKHLLFFLMVLGHPCEKVIYPYPPPPNSQGVLTHRLKTTGLERWINRVLTALAEDQGSVPQNPHGYCL